MCHHESIVTDATTFEMELCGHKQATAHAHLQPQCVCLNFEHTKNSNPSKNIFFATKKFEFESANSFQKPPKSFEIIFGRMVKANH